jgi:putative redox protein
MTEQELIQPSATAKAIITHAQYQTIVSSGKHAIIVDEPEDVQGTDTGLNPNELLLGSLSSCTAITLQMYINRKMWSVEEIVVDLELFILEDSTLIKSKIKFKGDLTTEQIKRLEHIAEVCPVHKILTGTIAIETTII